MQGSRLSANLVRNGRARGLDCRCVDLRCAGKADIEPHQRPLYTTFRHDLEASYIRRLDAVDRSPASGLDRLGQKLKWEAIGRTLRFRVEHAHAPLRSTQRKAAI